MRKKEKDKIKVGRYDRTDFYGVCVCVRRARIDKRYGDVNCV